MAATSNVKRSHFDWRACKGVDQKDFRDEDNRMANSFGAMLMCILVKVKSIFTTGLHVPRRIFFRLKKTSPLTIPFQIQNIHPFPFLTAGGFMLHEHRTRKP